MAKVDFITLANIIFKDKNKFKFHMLTSTGENDIVLNKKEIKDLINFLKITLNEKD